MLKQIMTINPKVREFLWGLVMVILVSLFTYTVVKIFTERSDKKYQESLLKITQEAERREAKAIMQRDSAAMRDELNYQKVSNLEFEILNQRDSWNKFQKNYEKSLNELKQIKNEKEYIPTTATANEQFDFISNYKYESY